MAKGERFPVPPDRIPGVLEEFDMATNTQAVQVVVYHPRGKESWWQCLECGSVVAHVDRHFEWHQQRHEWTTEDVQLIASHIESLIRRVTYLEDLVDGTDSPLGLLARTVDMKQRGDFDVRL